MRLSANLLRPLTLQLLQPDDQQGDVRGCDSRDAPRLTEGGRADFAETHLRLLLEAADGGVVEVGRELAAFLAGHAVDLRLLPAEVALILEIGLDQGPDVVGKLREQGVGESLP